MTKRLVLTFIICTFYTLTSFAQKKQVLNGNKLYQQKKYKEAANAYQQALTKNPTYTPGMFNLGDALFQQKNYDASRKVMDATAKQSADKNVKADANYNIGNSYMQEQKWEDAINAYKQSLRNNPHDEAAKYNLSYALQMMKKNNNQNKNNKNKDKNKDQKDQKNNQDKDKQDKNNDQNKQDKKDQQNKDQQNQNKDQQNDQKDQQNKDKEDNQHKQPQPSKLTQQQADQLLNALAQDEKKLQDNKEKGKAVKIKMDKDW